MPDRDLPSEGTKPPFDLREQLALARTRLESIERMNLRMCLAPQRMADPICTRLEAAFRSLTAQIDELEAAVLQAVVEQSDMNR